MGDVLEQIKEIEAGVAAVLQRTAEEVAPLDRQLQGELAALAERRAALVSGKAPPTPEELEGLAGDAEALAAASQHGSHGHGAAGKAGCPFYWAAVLSNCDAVAERLSGRDRLALEYLRDVRALGGGGGGGTGGGKGGKGGGLPPGARGVELVFDAKNPYFTNKVLRRVIGGGADEGTLIDWKPGMDLTVKEVTKRAKKKGGKKGGGGGAEPGPARVIRKPCPSFFRFFEGPPPAAGGGEGPGGGADARLDRLLAPGAGSEGEEEDDEEEAAEKAERAAGDASLMAALLGDVLLRPTHLYLEGPLAERGPGSGGGAGGRGASSDEGAGDDDDDYEMVAGGSTEVTVAELPPRTRAVVAALQAVQAKADAAIAAHRAARRAAAARAASEVREAYAARRALVAGPGAPRCFWLRVLRSVDAAALAITPRDAAVLQHLTDVRFEVAPAAEGEGGSGSDGGGSSGGGQVTLHASLELEFGEGAAQLAPGARALKKAYTFLASGGGGTGGGEPSLRLLSSRVASAPEWAAGDPTHRRARDGKSRPCASFFQLFRAGGGGGKWAFNLTGPEKDVQAEANALEVELLEELQALLPTASAAYAAVTKACGGRDDIAADGDEGAESSEEEDDDGEEGSEGGSGDEGDGEAAAARRAALRQKQHKRDKPWWRLGRNGVLVLLLLFIVVAQYVAIFARL